ncbi:hypothetical protein HYW99_03860 [Candidatus Woesearchaeota archaeon]|nr:hypothetical protein [Candidatus Woesearchaeota archaeon]
MVTKDEARRYLSNVPPEQSFWVNNGSILKNLEELADAIFDMGKETFQHHVNKEKNDFSTWISDVVGDKKLANDLLSSKSKDSMLKKLRKRLNSLKKKAA